MKHLITAVIIAFSLFIMNIAEAKNLYRYTDSSGKIIVKDYLPIEAVSVGYEVISDTGRVIERVSPALTREQKRAETVRQEQLKLQENKRLKERQRDTLLMRQYQTVSDIERTKKSQTSTLAINLRIVNNHTKSLNRKLQAQEKRAADYERKGKPVPEMTLHEIAAIKNQITSNEESVERYNNQIADIDKQFQTDRIRFQELKAEAFISDSLKDPNLVEVRDVFNCETKTSCDDAWGYAQIFAHKNSSRQLSIVTNTLIVSHKPLNEQQLALNITRVPDRSTPGAMNILIAVDCHPSKEGIEKCRGADVVALKQRFIDFLTQNSATSNEPG